MASCSRRPESVFPCGAGRARPSPNQGGAAVSTGVQHITFEGTTDGVAVRSYWKVVQGLASTNTRTLNAMGFYDDFCVKFDGRWLIKEKRIYRCNDETPLPW
jgi:hypothetical protein